MMFYFLNTQQMIARLKTKAAYVDDGSFQEGRRTLRSTDAYPHAHARSVWVVIILRKLLIWCSVVRRRRQNGGLAQ